MLLRFCALSVALSFLTLFVSERALCAEPMSGDMPTTFLATTLTVKGDNIAAIARRSGTTVREVLELNHGLETAKIIPGFLVQIPQPLTSLPRLTDVGREISRGIRGRKQIALTFDCGYLTSKQLDDLLETLDRNETKATFFLTGLFLNKIPSASKRISRKGHILGNHTYSHPHCFEKSDEEIRDELLRVEEMVLDRRKRTTRPFWRPPFGERDERILRAAAAAGFQAIYWTWDSHDWFTTPLPTPESIFHRVCIESIEKSSGDQDPLDGAIILMHAGGVATPQSLDLIIPYLKGQGYHFVTVDLLCTPQDAEAT